VPWVCNPGLTSTKAGGLSCVLLGKDLTKPGLRAAAQVAIDET
jgi:hypothetical protein